MAAATAAVTVEVAEPLPGQSIPDDHPINVTVVMPMTLAAFNAGTRGARIRIDSDAPQNVFSGYAREGQDVGGTPVTLFTAQVKVEAFTNLAGAAIEVQLDWDGPDAGSVADYQGTITWTSFTPSVAQQPFFPVILPALAGDERAEPDAVRRLSATDVMACGLSLDQPGTVNEVGHAVAWRFDGSALTTIHVHDELSLALATLGLDSLEGSQASVVNGAGQVAGICIGPVAGTDTLVLWLREANGTIRKLAVIASGAAVDAEPEVCCLTENGWVLSDLVAAGADLPLPLTGNPGFTAPRFRGMAYRWNGASVDSIDLHDAAAQAAGVADEASIATAAIHGRAGAGNALGVVTGMVYDPDIDRLVPYVRSAAGVITVDTTAALGDIGWGAVIDSTGTKLVTDAEDPIDSSTRSHLAGWNASGVVASIPLPTYFAGDQTIETSYRDTVDTPAGLDLLVGDEAWDDLYQTSLLPIDWTGASPVVGARVRPQWQVKGSRLTPGVGGYINLNLDTLDGVGSDRVYAGEGWNGDGPHALMLVHTDRLVDATDLAIAYPVNASSIPAGQSVPVVVSIENLSLLRQAERLIITVDDLNDAAPAIVLDDIDVPSELEVGDFQAEKFLFATAGHNYEITARLEFDDLTTYEETSTVSAANVAATYAAIDLPLPDDDDAGAEHVVLDTATTPDTVWVAGGYFDTGLAQDRAAYWTWQPGSAATVTTVPAVPGGTVAGVTIDANGGGWCADVALIDGVPTILVMRGATTGGTYDAWMLAYRPVQDVWAVIGQFCDDIPNGQDGPDPDPQFLADGSVMAEVVSSSGVHSVTRFTRTPATLTWTPANVPMPGGSVASGATGAGGTAAVGYFKRGDGLPRLFHQGSAGAGATELIGLDEHPNDLGTDLWAWTEMVGATPRIGYIRIDEYQTAQERLRSFVRDGLAGADVPLLSYAPIDNDTGLYSMNSDGDLVGGATLVGPELQRATRWTAAGVPSDLNFTVSSANLAVLGASGNALTIDEARGLTARIGGLPIMSARGEYWEPAVADSLGRALLLVPLTFLAANNDPPVLATIAPRTGPANAAIQIPVSAFDLDGDTLTFSTASPVNGTASYAAGVVTFTPTAAYTGAASFTVSVSDGQGGSDSQVVDVTIYPASGLTATITALGSTIDEDSSGTFRITLSGLAPPAGVQVALAVSGTATRGNDFLLRFGGSALPVTGPILITIPVGQLTRDIQIEGVDDADPEVAETIIADLTTVDGAAVTPSPSTTATVTIDQNDFAYFVLWAQRRVINDHPEQGESGELVWWMEATPGKTIASATFTFPGGATRPGIVEPGGDEVTVEGGEDINVSLADLQAGTPNGLYRVDLTYTDTSTEFRTENATFSWGAGWPDYATTVAPAHQAANVAVDGDQRVSVTFSGGPVGWISLQASNGPSGNASRDYFESDWLVGLGGSGSYLIPVQTMTNQPYRLQVLTWAGERMGSLSETAFSTGSLPTFGASADNWAATAIGDIPVASYVMRYKAQGGAITPFTRTVSHESAILPGSAGVSVPMVKVLEVRGGISEATWYARANDNGIYAVRSTYDGVDQTGAVAELILPPGATVSTAWYSGTTEDLTTLTSITATAPTALRTNCLKLDLPGLVEQTWIQPGFGLVEFQSDPAAGIDYLPLNPSSDPIIAGTTTTNTTEDAAASIIGLSATDPDTPAGSLTWSIVTLPTKGTASLSATTGSTTNLTYAPGADQNGADSVVVQISDGTFTDSETVNFTIAAVNDAPTASAGAAVTVNEDSGAYSAAWATAISVGPADEAAQTMSFPISGLDAGELAKFAVAPVISASGVLTFTPALDANGAITGSATPTDSAAGTAAPLPLSITLTAVNDPPVNTAVPVVAMVGNDATSTNGTWNDAKDSDPGAITYAHAWFQNTVGSGTGTVIGGATASTLSNAIVHTFVRCEVTATDAGSPGNANAMLTSGWVKTVNALPTIPAPSTYAVTEDTSAGASAVATATDPDGSSSAIVWSIVTPATMGTATLSGSPGATVSMAFVPTASLNGSDSVVLRATDADGGFTDTTVPIAIAAVNDAPSYTAGAGVTVVEDASAYSAAWASAISAGAANESQTLSFAIAGLDAGEIAMFSAGPAIAANGTLSFAAAANANGVATMTATLTDDATAGGAALSSAALALTITITAANDVPTLTVVVSPVVSAEDSGATGSGAFDDVVAGPADEAAQTVTIAISGLDAGEQAKFSIQPTITVTGDVGALAYSTAANANGTVTGFATPSDSAGATGIAYAFSIELTPVNDGPVNTAAPTLAAAAGTATAVDGTWNDAIDGGSSTITYTRVWYRNTTPSDAGRFLIPGETAPTHVIDLAADFYLQVVVTATDDGTGPPATQSATAQSAWLRAVNTPPAANSAPVGSLAVTEDTVASAIATLTATADDATPLANMAWSVQTQGAKGVVTLSAATGSSITATYAPNANATGSDSATVRVTDGDGGTTDLGLSFTIAGVNDAPVFVVGTAVSVAEDSGAYSASAASAIAVGPVGATDESGQVLTFSIVATNPSLFSVAPAMAANGTLTFTPAPDANGTSTLTITLADDGTPSGTSAGQTLAVTVTAVNDAPSRAGGLLTVARSDAEDSGVIQAVIASFGTGLVPGPADEAAQILTASKTTADAGLFLVQPRLEKIGADWILTYAIDGNVAGSAMARFNVTDSLGDSSGDVLQVDFTVTAVNDAPRFTAGPSIVVVAGASLSLTGWASAISPGGGADEAAQTVAFAVTPGTGITSAALAANGTLTLTAGASAATTTLAIVASDSGGADADPVVVQVTIVAVDTLVISAPDEASAVGWGPIGFTTTSATTVDIPVLVAWSGAGTPGAAVTNLQPSAVAGVATVASGFTVTYTPPSGFTGVDTITITVTVGAQTAVTDVPVYVSKPVDNDVADTSTAAETDPPVDTPTAGSDHTIDSDPEPVAPFALLAVPVGGDPLTLADLGIDRLVKTFDPTLGDWRIVAPDEALDPFTGYWIEPGPPLDLPDVVAAPVTRLERPLMVGWNAFAAPLASPVNWQIDDFSMIAIRIDTAGGSTVMNLFDAYAAGYVEHVAWRLGPDGYVPVVDASTPASGTATSQASDQTDVIEAGSSYLFRVLAVPAGATLTLIISDGSAI